jgi:hypothetical protein
VKYELAEIATTTRVQLEKLPGYRREESEHKKRKEDEEENTNKQEQRRRKKERKKKKRSLHTKKSNAGARRGKA